MKCEQSAVEMLAMDMAGQNRNPQGLNLAADAIWREPLQHMAQKPWTRLQLRLLVLYFRRYVLEFRGLEHILPDCDPFILAPNHNQKLEAVLLPTLLIYLRHGKLIHFLSDWNFRMIPVLASMLRRSGTIVLMNKSARPRFLNVLKPLFDPGVPGWVRAQQKLEEKASVGIYVEGTINRNPTQLLRGYSGASRLSLTTRVPVVPVGITFPTVASNAAIPEWTPMVIHIGSPMHPPSIAGAEPSSDEIKQWHQQIMLAISRLSGKQWRPDVKRKLS
jgi:1-acyl-sn-glycerol-3-phosphate acyltransferase